MLVRFDWESIKSNCGRASHFFVFRHLRVKRVVESQRREPDFDEYTEGETSALLTRWTALGRALLTETKVESGDVSKQKWNLS